MQNVSVKFCNNCGHGVLAVRNPISHAFHLLMTILTAGMWFMVWLWIIFSPRPWRCVTCGNICTVDPLTNPQVGG